MISPARVVRGTDEMSAEFPLKQDFHDIGKCHCIKGKTWRITV
jgi:hypothetical protein